jgi:hypothetical protein
MPKPPSSYICGFTNDISAEDPALSNPSENDNQNSPEQSIQNLDGTLQEEGHENEISITEDLSRYVI